MEGLLNTYMMEASRARLDPLDRSAGKRHAPSRSSRRHKTDGSDDEEADTGGHVRPRALPRTLPV
jgi:hypothetical protein